MRKGGTRMSKEHGTEKCRLDTEKSEWLDEKERAGRVSQLKLSKANLGKTARGVCPPHLLPTG